MLNTVALVGRLVDIPEMKTTIGGVKVANATIQSKQITSIEVIAERVSLLDKYFKNYD